MSRPIRLTIGLLLITAAGMVAFLFMVDGPKNKHTPSADGVALFILTVPFALPGLLLIFRGCRSEFTQEERNYLKMKFIPKRLLKGLGIALGGVAFLWFFFGVMHEDPDSSIFLAIIAAPCGFIYAATSWTEACRACGKALTSNKVNWSQEEQMAAGLPADNDKNKKTSLSIQYCPRCGQIAFVTNKRQRHLLHGTPAEKFINFISSHEEKST